MVEGQDAVINVLTVKIIKTRFEHSDSLFRISYESKSQNDNPATNKHTTTYKLLFLARHNLKKASLLYSEIAIPSFGDWPQL